MEAAALGQAQEELSLLERETVLPTHNTTLMENQELRQWWVNEEQDYTPTRAA